MRAPNSDDFRGYIIQRFRDGETEVKTFIDLKAGEVHRGVGGYPAPDGNHRMLVLPSNEGRDAIRRRNSVLAAIWAGRAAPNPLPLAQELVECLKALMERSAPLT